MLYIIGLGTSGELTTSASNAINNAKAVVVRTAKTSATEFLRKSGIKYISLDDEYERSRSFSSLNKNLVKRVLDLLKETDGDLCYLVDGAVCEDASAELLYSKVKNATVFEGVSKAQAVLSMAGLFATSHSAVSAYDIESFSQACYPLVIYDLDSRLYASLWKIKLAEIIGEDEEIILCNKTVKKIKLYELDRENDYDYSTAVVINKLPLEKRSRFDYDDLLEILKFLRSENGCPWDKVQTHDSIRNSLIEECYELIDAIDKKDDDKMLEEIGDVLLQAAFHSLLGKERNAFSSGDIISGVCEKLIFRHSHIFGTDKADSVSSVLNVWDKNKIKEKGFESTLEYVEDVPKCFPSLMRAKKVLKRSSSYFNEVDLKSITALIGKLVEQLENDSAISQKLLLSMVVALSVIKVDGEESLYKATDAFVASLKNLDENKKIDLINFIKEL